MIVTIRWTGMRWTLRRQAACCRTKRLQRTAKSCGPSAATVASTRPACAGTATVTTNAAHRGEHEVSRKTIARGKPGCLGCTCLIRVRFRLPLHTVLRAQSAPGFPCALSKGEEQRDCTNSGENASRERAHMFPRHCERSEAIQLPRKRKLDCFVAPLLAMSVDGLFDR